MRPRQPDGSDRVSEQEVARLMRGMFAAHKADMSLEQVLEIYVGWELRSMPTVLGAIAIVLDGLPKPNRVEVPWTEGGE
jgi:hypothetical protein